MKNVVKSMMVMVGLVTALQAGASDVRSNLRELATGQDGCPWHLYMNLDTNKLEIMVENRCGNDIRHWVEDATVVCEESGPIANMWSYEIVSFHAAGIVFPAIIGAVVPRLRFIKHNRYGFAGLSVNMFKVTPKYSAEKRLFGVISIDFRGTYPMKPLFSYNAIRLYEPTN